MRALPTTAVAMTAAVLLAACGGSGGSGAIPDVAWPTTAEGISALLEELPTALSAESGGASRGPVMADPQAATPLTTVSYADVDQQLLAHVAVSNDVSQPGPAATLFGGLVWIGVPDQECEDFAGSEEMTQAVETADSGLEHAYADLAEVDEGTTVWFRCTVTSDPSSGEKLPREQWEYLAGWTAPATVYTVTARTADIRDEVLDELAVAAADASPQS